MEKVEKKDSISSILEQIIELDKEVMGTGKEKDQASQNHPIFLPGSRYEAFYGRFRPLLYELMQSILRERKQDYKTMFEANSGIEFLMQERNRLTNILDRVTLELEETKFELERVTLELNNCIKDSVLTITGDME